MYDDNREKMKILKTEHTSMQNYCADVERDRDEYRKKYNKEKTKHIEEIRKLRNDMRELRSKEKELTQKLNLYNGQSEVINTLSIQQLDELEQTLMSSMKRLREARSRMLELERLCVACKDQKKNVLFVDGCDHIALCVECEKKLEPKKCPIQECQTPYSLTKAIKF